MQSSCTNIIYSIEYLDADRRSKEILCNLNQDGKNRMKLLKQNIRHLQSEIYAERLRNVEIEELWPTKAGPKAEFGPEKFHLALHLVFVWRL
jgi:hypothetical protein